jgi:hypothetical protein
LARKYTINSGKTSLAAAATQVACAAATGATVTNTVIGADCTFDSTATGSGAVAVLVEIVRTTGASSGGASATPAPWKKGQIASGTTGRKNDTSDGASPTVIAGWLISPTSGVIYQFPLGRDLEMEASDFVELRLTSQSGMTTCDYDANLHIEE